MIILLVKPAAIPKEGRSRRVRGRRARARATVEDPFPDLDRAVVVSVLGVCSLRLLGLRLRAPHGPIFRIAGFG